MIIAAHAARSSWRPVDDARGRRPASRVVGRRLVQYRFGRKAG